MKSQEFIIRQTTEEDWQRVRDLRLEMIRDTPIAFGETHEHALTLTEAEWRERGARARSPQLTLEVHEDNLRAQRYYELRGYARTGNTSAYELNLSKTLIEMTKLL
ncbi:hypothetical protein V5R04_12885 [Jonesiaceae bacterium BS-20]|uniref:GNAT family N-acetyltransferase n=1 Tax=Jonesiaceae bacterium BS-20 TaxID=3120821 RepID=A0AAU7DUT9_9MICO